jgi:hypothetical protein
MSELTIERLRNGAVHHDGTRGYLVLDLEDGAKAKVACVILKPEADFEGEAVTDTELDAEYDRESAALEAELGAQDPDRTLETEQAAYDTEGYGEVGNDPPDSVTTEDVMKAYDEAKAAQATEKPSE